MKLKIESKEILQDGVIRYQVKIPSSDFLYTGFLLESFEGVCAYTTSNKQEGILQIDVTADFAQEFTEIYKALLEFSTI